MASSSGAQGLTSFITLRALGAAPLFAPAARACRSAAPFFPCGSLFLTLPNSWMCLCTSSYDALQSCSCRCRVLQRCGRYEVVLWRLLTVQDAVETRIARNEVVFRGC